MKNKLLKKAVIDYSRSGYAEDFFKVMEVLMKQNRNHTEVYMPVTDNDEANEHLISLSGDNKDLAIELVKDDEGLWLPLYTSEAEFDEVDAELVISVSIGELLKSAKNNSRLAGVMIDPFIDAIRIFKDLIVFGLENYLMEE